MWKRWAVRILMSAVQERIMYAVMDIEPVERKADAIALIKQVKLYLLRRGDKLYADLLPFEVE